MTNSKLGLGSPLVAAVALGYAAWVGITYLRTKKWNFTPWKTTSITRVGLPLRQMSVLEAPKPRGRDEVVQFEEFPAPRDPRSRGSTSSELVTIVNP